MDTYSGRRDRMDAQQAIVIAAVVALVAFSVAVIALAIAAVLM